VTPGVVSGAVGHDDILPTVLDALGLAVPSGVSGQSLTTAPPADRGVYFEAMDAALTRGWSPLTGIASARWKLIDLPERELYDVAHDAGEVVNVAAREPAIVQSLDRGRQVVLASPGPAAPAAPRDADSERRLRALGYVAAAGGSTPAAGRTPGLDPKRLVGVHERFTAALEAVSSARRDEALATLLAIVDERPEFTAARTSAATVLIETGRPREAVALLTAAPPGTREAPDLMAKLGVARREAGDLKGARTALEAVRSSGWQNPEVLNDLGVVYARLGRVDDARSAFTALTNTAPQAADAWNNLGVLELRAGRPREAAAAFRRAVEADPGFGDAWQGLGAALVEHDRAGAIDAWRRAEPLLPGDFDLLYNLGMLLAASDRTADAVPYLTRFLRDAPAARYGRDRTQVQALLRKAGR
jgi:Flp pilus assembly protein TadD